MRVISTGGKRGRVTSVKAAADLWCNQAAIDAAVSMKTLLQRWTAHVTESKNGVRFAVTIRAIC